MGSSVWSPTPTNLGLAAATGGLSIPAQIGFRQATNSLTPGVPRLPEPINPDRLDTSRGSKRVQGAANRAIAAAAARSSIGGLASTIATGPKGLTTPAFTTQKTLLGN